MLKEVQRFSQKWMWFLLIAVQLLVLGDIIYPYLNGTQHDIIGMDIFAISIPAMVMLFLYYIRLDTTINEEGIQIRIKPLVNKKILWEDIIHTEVIKLSPMKEYGGYGIRYSMKGNGWGYFFLGYDAVRFKLKNGTIITLGTQQIEVMKKVLKYYKKID